MNKELLDIGSVIKQAALLVQRTLTEERRIQLEVPQDTINLYGHRSKLVELISGTIRQYCQFGDHLVVNATVKQSGTKLVLRIRANGVEGTGNSATGIDQGVITEFEHIVHEHQGRWEKEGIDGVMMELPIAVVPRIQEKEGAMQDDVGKCKVLVVDDNVDGAVTLSVILKHMGHSVRITHDGNSALAVGAEFAPDLVLMDIGMPGMDGYETCERMRKEQWSGKVRIVALTGWGQEEDKRKARRAGFDLHLVKPVDRKTLMDVISTTMEGRPLDSVPIQGGHGR